MEIGTKNFTLKIFKNQQKKAGYPSCCELHRIRKADSSFQTLYIAFFALTIC